MKSITELSPIFLLDGYKVDHRRQYPAKTTHIYSNFTPRKSRIPGRTKVVMFGLQYFIMEYLVHRFNEYFFYQPRETILKAYKRRMDNYLGKDMVPVEHIGDLHDLGYLPLKIKALPEGTLCPIKVPMLTIENTRDEFFWLTNSLETLLSNTFWKMCTSATTAYAFRQRFEYAAKRTGYSQEFVKFQGHDFSFRGMSFVEDALASGAAHLTSFAGTDTIPAIDFVEMYYGANSSEELVGASVPATEHSVASLGILDTAAALAQIQPRWSSEECRFEAEVTTLRRLITEVYPKGIVSYVADTYDFWQVVTKVVERLKPEIMAREGKLVCRPDSGDPVKVVCGDTNAPVGSPEYKGAVQCLWDVFGGSVTTSHGFKQLDSHIGLIYGDAITENTQEQIIDGLIDNGFAPDLVLGMGSYSYQLVTRDTYGFAMKATHGVVDGQPRPIYKDPKTDRSSEKKSARGLLSVYKDDFGAITLYDNCTSHQEAGGMLWPVFLNGKLPSRTTLAQVRSRLYGSAF